MVDFLTIVKLGNLVGAVSPPLADRFAVPLAICRDVAEGKEVPAARLLEGQ